MRSYCYGSDSDDEPYSAKRKAKSKRAKPTSKPDPTPSEPKPRDQKRENNDADPSEYGYDANRENEGTAQRQPDRNGREPKGLACEGDETSEHERLEHGNDGVCELREPVGTLTRPQLVYHEESGEYIHPDFCTPTPRVPTMHSRAPCAIVHDDRDPNAKADTEAFTRPQLVYHEESGEYVHPDFYTPTSTPRAATMCNPVSCTSHPTPTSPPTHLKHPPPSSPAPPSPARATSPASNQQGHVTALNHAQHANAPNNDEREPAPVNSTTPRPEPHIIWPLRTWPNVPPAPSATVDYNGMPQYIPRSRPLRPQPRRPRYKRTCTERKRIPNIPIPTLPIPTLLISAPFATCSDTSSTLAAARAPAISFATGKLSSENTTHQYPNQYQHNGTAPYSTIRSRPPPWPIKYQNRNQHRHYGKLTPARETTRQRPLPWPNQPPQPHRRHHTVIRPIIFIPPARPPPWPILSSNTLRNHRNARRQLRKGLGYFLFSMDIYFTFILLYTHNTTLFSLTSIFGFDV
jgi:hypothetical protein